MEKFNLQSETVNVPRFNKKSVDLWFQYIQKVFVILVLIFSQAYGVDAFNIEEDGKKSILQFLPKEYL